MSVMLAFGLTLGALGYKQQVLASTALSSQYAFYAADAALECALYADQQQGLFAYNPDLNAPTPVMTCNGGAPLSEKTISHTSSLWVTTTRIKLDGGAHCADVTIYKPSPGTQPTYAFAQGYDVSCTTVASPPTASRFTTRGLDTHY